MVEKKFVLIVEDDEDIQDIYKDMILESFDVDLAQSYDGKQGLEVVAKRRPDFIILDLLMPVMDGETFLKELRNSLNLKDIPVVVCSVNQTLAHKLLTEKSVEAVLPKLFMQKDLIAVVTQFLSITPKTVHGKK